jgi:hypothetical protein
MKLGDTFRPDRFDNHLWVVISDPSIDSEDVVVVNLTTHKNAEEEACILDVGDHPFIKHKTVVRYRNAYMRELSHFQYLIELGSIRIGQKASKTMLKKIWNGARQSRHIPSDCLAVLEKQGLLPD